MSHGSITRFFFGLSRRTAGFLLAVVALGAMAEGGRAQPLVVARNQNGRLEVFQVGVDGDLRHRWQNTADGSWSGWRSLEGFPVRSFCVQSNFDGQLEVFAVCQTNGSVACVCQDAANSLKWSQWTNLGGAFLGSLAAGQNKDGRLEVFAIDAASHAVKHSWQNTLRGSWSVWTDLGGAAASDLIAMQNRDGRLEVFALNGAGQLVHCWQRVANGDWSAWANLGGDLLPGIAAGQNMRGRAEIFGIDKKSGAAARICQSGPSTSTNWTGWLPFGGKFKGGVATGRSADLRMEVFAINSDTSLLMHRWEDFPNGSDVWSEWDSMGETAESRPAVECDVDGDLEVFTAGPNNSIRCRRQISSASDWLDWANLDQPPFEFAVRSWQVADGLPDNMVQAIAQTPDGFLWVGTRSGLARFDGVEFSRFDTRNTPEIRVASITTLCASRDGALWIGTGGGGVARYEKGAFTHFGREQGLAGNDVRCIYESNDGSVWIGTTTGMSRYRRKTFVNYTTNNGLLSDFVSYITMDREGNLWIATGKGLNRLKKKGVMESYVTPNRLPNDSVRAICQDHGGRIWVGANNGLLWFDQYWTNHFYAYNTRYGLSDKFVSAICEGRNGNLWVGTYSGLNRFFGSRFYPQLDNEGQPFSKVNALLEDSEGDLWVGTQEGLMRLARKSFFTYTQQQGLTHNNVMSVLQDHRGKMWIGTWGGGLVQMQGGDITSFTSSNGMPQDLLLSLAEGHAGGIWIGADFDGGLSRLKDGKIERFTWKNGLINARIQALMVDSSNDLWIGTSSGLSYFKNGKFTNFTTKNGLADDNIHAILQDRSGAVWLASDSGLDYRRNGKFFHYSADSGLPEDSMISLYEAGDGSIWAGSEGGGLARFRNGRFTIYTTEQGLFSDTVYSILEDGRGWMWMSCPQGIFRVLQSDFDELDARKRAAVFAVSYGKADGMESTECNGAGKPSAWKSSDGSLWFATTKGLVTVDPQSLRINLDPPGVYIEQLLANGKPRLSPTWPQLPPAADESIRIPPGRGGVEFRYTAPNLSAPEKERFKYKLEGADAEWMDAGARRSAYYNNLAPGPYRFRVKACNNDGVWNERGASLSFALAPFFWQTWWFEALVMTAAAGAVGASSLYLTRSRLRRKMRALQAQQAVEKERRRIAKDMHDQLGAGLTQISLLGEFARREQGQNGKARAHVEKICDVTRELAQTVDEIVWAVNPRNDTLNKLAGYLAAYAEDYFQASPTRCLLDIPAGLPAIPLSAELRHNVFLVVKEALNNIVKHSNAAEAWIRLAFEDSTLTIRIEDNGNGFRLDAANATGNGLVNMKERLREIHGTLTLESEPQGGTRLCLEIPLKQPAARERNRRAAKPAAL